MIPIEFLEDYFIDQEDGLKKLLTWFLNLVMQLEAVDQAAYYHNNNSCYRGEPIFN